MTYRRIIITTTKSVELKKELDRLFTVTKQDFPDMKSKIIKGAKENVTIVDLTGDGADSFANKVKDSGTKIGATDIKIRKEKKLSPVKEELDDKKGSLLEEIQALKNKEKVNFTNDYLDYISDNDRDLLLNLLVKQRKKFDNDYGNSIFADYVKDLLNETNKINKK